MQTYSVVHNVLPMRSHRDPRSEMVSQAVFGETVTVLGTDGEYSLVRTEDNYEGWAPTIHLTPTSSSPPRRERIVTEAFAPVYSELSDENLIDKRLTTLSMGSRVRILEPDQHYTKIELPSTPYQNAKEGTILTFMLEWQYSAGVDRWTIIYHCANQLMGTPYLWGGTSAFGIDCSGFVQRIFGMAGIRLPRDAYQQAASPLGEGITDTETPGAMDIVFFRGREDPRQRGITHVGVARNSEQFYHASSKCGVVLSRFDDPMIRDEYTYMGGLRIGQR